MQKFGLQNFHTNKLTWDVQTFCGGKRWMSGSKQEGGEEDAEKYNIEWLMVFGKASWDPAGILIK